jgi:PilZ domain
MDNKRSTPDRQQVAIQDDVWLTRAVADATRDDHDASSRQRVSIRKSIPCNMLVRVGSSYVIARRIHDISLVGAFVDMDTAGLAVGDLVEVVIGFVYNQRQIEHQISAEVVRVETDGAGFRFCTYCNRTYTDLVNLLYAQ